jgi:hypothetical protein
VKLELEGHKVVPKFSESVSIISRIRNVTAGGYLRLKLRVFYLDRSRESDNVLRLRGTAR